MASIDDVLIKIGVDPASAGKFTKFIEATRLKLVGLAATVAKAAGSMIKFTTQAKLDAVIKEQKRAYDALAGSLDMIIRRYDMATYKAERMANAIKNETAAAIQRLSAYRALDAAAYDTYRRQQIAPGMTPRQAFEKGAKIDAAQRQSDISYAEKVQVEAERSAMADVARLESDRKATARKLEELKRLRGQVQVARSAIANEGDFDFAFQNGFGENLRRGRKRVEAAFARTFGASFGASAFWSDPEIQNFKGSYSELSKKMGEMILETQKSLNGINDALTAAKAGYDNTKATGRADIRSMKEVAATTAEDEARRFRYDMNLANEQRGAAVGDRSRSVAIERRELEWKRRSEMADREGQRKILDERRAFYEGLAETEREVLKRFKDLREEDLTAEDKWRRDRAEGRLFQYEDTLRGLGEESRLFEKRGGDVERYQFAAGQRDLAEERAELARGLSLRRWGAGMAAAADTAHWRSRLSDVTARLDGLARRYGAKVGPNGSLDYSTIDFRALRNNEYDSAVFDRLQGKASAYGGSLAGAVGGIMDALAQRDSMRVEMMANKNRLTAMGLGGGEAAATFGRDMVNNTKEATQILRDILAVLGRKGGAVWLF